MNEKEQTLLKKRFLDLQKAAHMRNIPTFSDFLNGYELDMLYGHPQDFPCGTFRTFGGHEFSERQMAVFLPEALFFDFQYPIKILEIKPLLKKFADDLSHRDFLGALMNLGIERSKIGDILVEDSMAYVFCCEHIAPYICENLYKIKHTNIQITETDYQELQIQPRFTEITGSVSSIRLDSVLALAFNKSRSSLTDSISAGKVFVNDRLVTSNGHPLHQGDKITLRGMGKFILENIGGKSKKGKTYITLQKYS